MDYGKLFVQKSSKTKNNLDEFKGHYMSKPKSPSADQTVFYIQTCSSNLIQSTLFYSWQERSTGRYLKLSFQSYTRTGANHQNGFV